MARTWWVAVALVLAAAGPARADDAAAEPKLSVGGSLAVWFPTSDADDVADTSLGVRPQAAYWVNPYVGVTASFDFVFVNEQGGGGDVTYYAISAGARARLPRGRIRPYGELLFGWHFLSSDALDDNNFGFRLGGGATYALGSKLDLSAGLGYSTTSFDGGFFDFTVAAFIFDVGIAARL